MSRHLSLLLVLSWLSVLTGCNDNEVVTARAHVANFNLSVKAIGELASSDTAYLTPPSVSGMWQYKLQYLAREGAHVKAKEVIARFDNSKVKDKLNQKRDELNTVSKELENLLLQQERDKEDLKVQLAQREVALRKAKRKSEQVDESTGKVDSEKLALDLRIAQLDLTLYQNKREQYETKSTLQLSIKKREKEYLAAEVGRLEKDREKLMVRSPKSGLFIYGNNYNGDKFAVGDTLHTGQMFAEIPSLEKMIVKARISERNLGRLRIGMAVEITLDANTQKKYSGRLVGFGNVIREKSVNNPEKVIEADIAIDNPDLKMMRPGMIARLSVAVDTYKDVVVVPSQAVTLEAGRATVRLKTWFGEQRQTVKVLAFDDQQTAIAEGVKAGQELIL